MLFATTTHFSTHANQGRLLDLALSAMSGAVAEIDAKQYKVDLQFVGEEQKQAYVENYLD